MICEDRLDKPLFDSSETLTKLKSEALTWNKRGWTEGRHFELESLFFVKPSKTQELHPLSLSLVHGRYIGVGGARSGSASGIATEKIVPLHHNAGRPHTNYIQLYGHTAHSAGHQTLYPTSANANYICDSCRYFKPARFTFTHLSPLSIVTILYSYSCVPVMDMREV